MSFFNTVKKVKKVKSSFFSRIYIYIIIFQRNNNNSYYYKESFLISSVVHSIFRYFSFVNSPYICTEIKNSFYFFYFLYQ